MPDSNPALAWALYHHAMGYCPFPLAQDESRAPLVKWKPLQSRMPSEAEVRSWFSRPGRNLALVTGAFHGIVAIDCDDAEAERFAKLHFDPTPYRVRTRRGLHLFYRHPGPGHEIITKPNVIPGYALDSKGEGGSITGLGSVHRSGFVYRLDDGARVTPPEELPRFDPSWLPAPPRLQAPTAFRGSGDLGSVERAERYLSKVPGSGKGGRNAHTFRVAASVVRDFGLTLDQGWALMSAWNLAHNDPPLPEDELKVIVQSCLQSGRRPMGAKLSAVSNKM